MSIINQMLRDLDARHASANERAGLPTGLRTLPPEQTPRSKTWLLLAAGLIVGALIAWFFVSQTAVPPAPPVPSPATVAQAPEQQAAPAPAPVTIPVPAPAPVVAPVAKPPTPAVATPPTPVATPPAKPAAAPVEKSVSVKTVASPPAVTAPVPVIAPAPAGEGQIDKHPKGDLSRDQAETEYRKGMQAAGIGDAAAALPALRRALDLDPQHAKARQALLSVLASNRQWDEVKQVAQSGLALDPARTGWASILARLQHEQGDTDGAVKTLEAHAAHAAGNADFQGLFAFLLQKRQRYAEAAQHYQMALALRPGEGRWWFGLGLALEAAGRGDEAKAAFGKARDAGNLPTDMLGILEQKLK